LKVSSLATSTSSSFELRVMTLRRMRLNIEWLLNSLYLING
jgi:hypothetical protein